MEDIIETLLRKHIKERISELKRGVAELQEQLDEKNKQINNMSEQQQSPYAGRQLTTDKVVHKTLTAATLGELDTLVSEALNDGCQPAGPIMQLQDGTFAMPTVKVPRSMMPQPR